MFLTVAGTAIGGWLLWLYRTHLKNWLLSEHSIEVYGWLWIFGFGLFLFLIIYSLQCVLRDKGRLKNPHDIVSAIDTWLSAGDRQFYPVEMDTPYYFCEVERDRNLKRGSSLKYLPMIAFRHNYAFEMGKKTFKLTNLTPDKDPRNIFEKHFKPIFNGEEKEIFLSCKDIDKKLGWPEGATKAWLLSRPNTSEEFKIEDEGGDKIRIVQKK